MALLTSVAKIVLGQRYRAIERFMLHPTKVQHEQLMRLTKALSITHYGKDHSFKSGGYEEFVKRVPIVEYDDISVYSMRSLDGEKDILWPGRTAWFAKSSGTTADKSKFIPVTYDALFKGQFLGGRDALALYLNLNPSSKLFDGKSMTLGGSRAVERGADGAAFTGDLSAIMIENTPSLLSSMRVPCKETALIASFTEKVEAICKELSKSDVRSFSGVPSWNLVLLSRIAEYNGTDNLFDVWPNMELFIHGGIAFTPYRESYKKLLPSSQMHYLETYNASEGFFGVADSFDGGDMLLMLDYGVYYEFLDMAHLGDRTKAIPLEDVKMGVNYALIITTTAGLWRYMIGDTVEFTSLSPYRIRITGRTSHYINTFGEEVMVSNADSAITAAAKACNAEVENYTVAPRYMDVGSKGAHQWAIEFRQAPSDIELFTTLLDKELQRVNSDYEAKRSDCSTLLRPEVTVVSSGTFYRWMESRGKLGGQNKIPRLYSERKYIDQLLKFI